MNGQFDLKSIRTKADKDPANYVLDNEALKTAIQLSIWLGKPLLLTGAPGMAIPASIIAGIGGILFYQNQTGDYSSWSYMWALIPGFVGVGTILAGLLGEQTRRNLSHGLNLIVISTVLFLVFATFFGGLSILGDYGAAIVLILLGLYVLIRGFVRGGYRGQNETR